MTRFHLLFVLLVLAIAVPFATADTINLTNTNLSGISNIGTVTLTNGTDGALSGVWVTLQANSGYSFKLNGGDILFNTSATLTGSSILSLTADGNAATFQKLAGHGPKPFGSFDYNLRNMTGPSGVSANTISFFISNVTLAQLQPYKWGVHFCTASGSNCGPQTGFATSGGTPVPEPGTLSLLGTGIVGLAGVFRRRFRS